MKKLVVTMFEISFFRIHSNDLNTQNYVSLSVIDAVLSSIRLSPILLKQVDLVMPQCLSRSGGFDVLVAYAIMTFCIPRCYKEI